MCRSVTDAEREEAAAFVGVIERLELTSVLLKSGT